MKNLKNDLTTKQQSEKLLALGMPRLSANFYYDDENEVQIVRDPEFELQSKGYFPCWSVGRLMEIYAVITEAKVIPFTTVLPFVDAMIMRLERLKDYYDIEFPELLEE